MQFERNCPKDLRKRMHTLIRISRKRECTHFQRKCDTEAVLDQETCKIAEKQHQSSSNSNGRESDALNSNSMMYSPQLPTLKTIQEVVGAQHTIESSLPHQLIASPSEEAVCQSMNSENGRRNLSAKQALTLYCPMVAAKHRRDTSLTCRTGQCASDQN